MKVLQYDLDGIRDPEPGEFLGKDHKDSYYSRFKDKTGEFQLIFVSCLIPPERRSACDTALLQYRAAKKAFREAEAEYHRILSENRAK